MPPSRAVRGSEAPPEARAPKALYGVRAMAAAATATADGETAKGAKSGKSKKLLLLAVPLLLAGLGGGLWAV